MLSGPRRGPAHSRLADFRWLQLSATLAALVGALLIPTFQRVFSRAVRHFQVHRSVPKLLMHGFLKGGLSQLRDLASAPKAANVTRMRVGSGVSMWVIGFNVAAVALWTIGVFASLYAGYLNPELRVTSSTLSSAVNGVATILIHVDSLRHGGETGERALVRVFGRHSGKALDGQCLVLRAGGQPRADCFVAPFNLLRRLVSVHADMGWGHAPMRAGPQRS